jgi:tetratricopeptide (TPR) repeat protein
MTVTAEIERLMREGSWEEARFEADKLVQLYPTHPKLQSYAGLCRLELNDYEGAVGPLQRAFALDPGLAGAGVKLAQTLQHLRRYREAYEVAVECLRLAPNDNFARGLVERLRDYDVEEHDSWERTRRLDDVIHFGGRE